MFSKFSLILLVLALAAGALAIAAYTGARTELRHLAIGEITPITGLLQERQEIVRALQADLALEKDSGILSSYLAKIRAEGLPKHADAKQRLDRLAENNSAILALINVYSPHAKTPLFSAEADRFRHYSIAWRDRWNSVMELFMEGGNYPLAEVPFPSDFPNVVQAEVEAAQRAL